MLYRGKVSTQKLALTFILRLKQRLVRLLLESPLRTRSHNCHGYDRLLRRRRQKALLSRRNKMPGPVCRTGLHQRHQRRERSHDPGHSGCHDIGAADGPGEEDEAGRCFRGGVAVSIAITYCSNSPSRLADHDRECRILMLREKFFSNVIQTFQRRPIQRCPSRPRGHPSRGSESTHAARYLIFEVSNSSLLYFLTIRAFITPTLTKPNLDSLAEHTIGLIVSSMPSVPAFIKHLRGGAPSASVPFEALSQRDKKKPDRRPGRAHMGLHDRSLLYSANSGHWDARSEAITHSEEQTGRQTRREGLKDDRATRATENGNTARKSASV